MLHYGGATQNEDDLLFKIKSTSLINMHKILHTIFTLFALLTRRVKLYYYNHYTRSESKIIVKYSTVQIIFINMCIHMTFDTSQDRTVQDFEQLPGKVNDGLGETVNLK